LPGFEPADNHLRVSVKLKHPALAKLLQRAYSAEKAAAFAYIGHAASLKNPAAKVAVKQIEDDEWSHRQNVLAMMQQYDIPISRFYEFKFHVIGRVISASCHVIGWFMPYFFAGKLESGNVCEYFVMMNYFHSLGIKQHDGILYEMGIKEKEHEVYFLEQIKDSKWLPYFERVFSWGKKSSANDVDLENKLPVEDSNQYCKSYNKHDK
jgi:rubrerythrin